MAPPTAICPGVKAIDISSRDGAPSPGLSASVRLTVRAASAACASVDSTVVGVASDRGARFDPAVAGAAAFDARFVPLVAGTAVFGARFDPAVAGAAEFDVDFDGVLVRVGALAFGAWL